MKEEEWDKQMAPLDNAKFNLQFAGTVPAETAGASRDSALSSALSTLQSMGGNGGVLDDPRRNYALSRQSVIDQLAPSNATLCPTESERSACEDGISVFGVRVGGESITAPCTGAPGECTMGDVCAQAMARDALPVSLRRYEDFLWQRSPYELGGGADGSTQSAGLDLIEAYWLARHYGFVTQGNNQVLAWKTEGSCQ
jgi:hypothetical protein